MNNQLNSISENLAYIVVGIFLTLISQYILLNIQTPNFTYVVDSASIKVQAPPSFVIQDVAWIIPSAVDLPVRANQTTPELKIDEIKWNLLEEFRYDNVNPAAIVECDMLRLTEEVGIPAVAYIEYKLVGSERIREINHLLYIRNVYSLPMSVYVEDYDASDYEIESFLGKGKEDLQKQADAISRSRDTANEIGNCRIRVGAPDFQEWWLRR